MFSNQSLTITSYDLSKRYFHSDNVNSYFSISNFQNENDGLFFKGQRLFSSIMPDFEKSCMTGKKLSPLWINVHYSSNESIRYLLMKNGDGLLLYIKNRKFFSLKNRKYPLKFKIEIPCEILEKNPGKIVLKYTFIKQGKPDEFIYAGIIAAGTNYMENIRMEEGILRFQIKPGNKEDDIKLYVQYDHSYEELIRLAKSDSINMESLKKKHLKNSMLPFRYSKFDIENKQFCKAMNLAVLSSSSFIMKSDENIGIWAGYPYFLNNWGRDTFISLSGICLTSGRYEEAIHILENFAGYQCKEKKSADYGKIPNIIDGDNVFYNSADATPLFIRAVYEYYLYTGNIEDVLSLWDTIKLAIDACYFSKKDRNNFISHEDAEDWMDAKKDGKASYSPRGGNAVEIQALWYTALASAEKMSSEILKKGYSLPDNLDCGELKKFSNLCLLQSSKLKKSFNEKFITENGNMIADHINSDYTIDTSIRPNSLLAIFYSSLPGITPLMGKDTVLRIFKKTIPEIVYKYGVSSLSKNDPEFHPYHINEQYAKDAAYHNGVIWNWLSGVFVSIACRYGMQDFSFLQTEELAKQIISTGSISELTDSALDAKGRKTPGGTFGQAWSVSEFCRSFFQNYLGIYPDVPERTLYFFPSIPVELGMVKSSIRFGMQETVLFSIKIDKNNNFISFIEIRGIKIIKPLTIVLKIRTGMDEKNGKFNVRYQYTKVLIKENNDALRLYFIQQKLKHIKLRELSITGQGELVIIKKGFETYDEMIDKVPDFASSIGPEMAASFNTIKEKDFLEKRMSIKPAMPKV